MVPHCIMFLLAINAQTDALFAGPVPAEVPTFEVTLGNTPAFYAGMRIDGQWVSGHGADIEPTAVVDFVPDGPLYTGEPHRTLMRNAHVAYEPPAMRRKRLKEMWDSLGYTFVETASGWRRVRKPDIDLAQRARELARTADAGQSSAKETVVGTTNATLPDREPRFSSGTLWAYRIGILLFALLVLALITVIGTRRGRRWERLE